MPVAAEYSGRYTTAPTRPSFPEPTQSPEAQQKKKDKDEFEKALKLADKKNPMDDIPTEEKSNAKKKTSADPIGLADSSGTTGTNSKSAEGGVFLPPEMQSISFEPTNEPTKSIPSLQGGGGKPVDAPKTAATANTFPGGGGKATGSSSGAGAAKSPSRGPDIPELGAPPATPTPLAGQALTSEGSIAKATPTPDPRIPPNPFTRTPATQPGATPAPTSNPNSPVGRQ